MLRLLRLAPLSLVALFGGGAHAQGLPDIDRALNAPAPTAGDTLASRNGVVASVAPHRGVPTFFWADRARAALDGPLTHAPPAEQAMAFVHRNARLYGLSPAALEAAYVREVHDTGRGGIVVILGQRIDGVELFQTEMKVLLDRGGRLVAIGGNLHGSATPTAKSGELAFTLDAAQAVAVAATDTFRTPLQAGDLARLDREKAGYGYFALAPGPKTAGGKLAFATPARAKKVFYALPGRLVPAYYLEVDAAQEAGTSSELRGYVIAADNGEILVRRNLVQDASYKYRVWADSAAPFVPSSGGPQADFAPHPTGVPDGSSPAFTAPGLVSVEAFNTGPNGAPDPWLSDAATKTDGNNVDAYADLAGPDGFTPGADLRATITSAFTFDRTFDTSLAPDASKDQIMAATTQMFFVTNWLHDYFYDSGFNEAAGNAQASNFGRGGVEGDSMRVEAQDLDGTNNANMTTPADGGRPRMQMYLWDGVTSSSLVVKPSNLMPAHQVASFGASSYNVTASLILANDGVGTKTDGCQALINNVAGKIVLLDRGSCTFESKVLRAQQAGAVGVLLASNNGSSLPTMTDDPATDGVTIGSLGISLSTGNTLKASLANGAPLTVTMVVDPGPMRDGSIDNDMVAHEWGHYLHHRLVACGSEQCGGESEGWGDFNALLMKVRKGDDVANGTFALGSYVTAAFGDAGYFGIRRFPYTRDLNKNGLTFEHMSNGEPLPAGPQQESASGNWERHNMGEVWASMLFQAYTGLLQSGNHPFEESKRRMADYMVAGMKMAPVDPTVTEQRDAILAAAAANDFNDFLVLAEGFAERGAGTCAVSPPRNSADGHGVVEDFSVSGRQVLASATLDDSVQSCDGDGILDAGEIGKLHLEVRNGGAAVLAGTTAAVTSVTTGISFPNGNTVTLPALAPFEAATATVDVALDGGGNVPLEAVLTVTMTNATSCSPSVKDVVSIRVHHDDVPDDSTTETVDSDEAPWTHWEAPGYEDLAADIWSRVEQPSGNFRFYGRNFAIYSDTALVSPDLVVGAAPLVISFAHAHDFESSPASPGQANTHWDGGVVEITGDGGATWQDVSAFGNPGYGGVIADVAGADNPLADRPAYVARNAAWPQTNSVTLNLGTAFAGKTVKIRFRVGTDVGVGAPDFHGWYLDDIAVQGITNKPFRNVMTETGECNLATKANAGADLVVDEGSLVALDASQSTDPENDALTFGWMQIAGPSIVLANAASLAPSFTAPEVAADTTLTFELTVSDGVNSDTDSVSVLVKDLSGSGGSAGGASNGGSDGGASDGGSSDGGSSDGGSSDGGASDGGGRNPVNSCTCRMAGGDSHGPGALLSPLLGFVLFLARRRQRAARLWISRWLRRRGGAVFFLAAVVGLLSGCNGNVAAGSGDGGNGGDGNGGAGGNGGSSGAGGSGGIACAGLPEIACLGAFPECVPVYDDLCCASCDPAGGCADCFEIRFDHCEPLNQACNNGPECGLVPEWACNGKDAGCDIDPGASQTPCASEAGCVPAYCPTDGECDVDPICHPVKAGMCVVQCDAIPPSCPAGTFPESDGFCHTGRCIPESLCVLGRRGSNARSSGGCVSGWCFS
ncbi:MAG: M36 family metallopeptidase [Polyangiaceae bacterium]|nr:M36 family metallopeptidase [Polyangiaceae bacterium]